MNPPDHSGSLTEVSDFAEVLWPTDGSVLPVLVGGHAVNLWSTYFLSKGNPQLADFLPFMSKDLDLVGTMALLDQLHRRFKGVVMRSEPRSPVFGRLEITGKEGGVLKIEVLHTVLGLNAKDLARTIDLQAGAILGRVPLPQLVLKAKIANAALIQQEGRQDVKHVRMMVICVAAFIRELLENYRTGALSERAVVNLLEEIREIVTAPNAEKATRLWGFDFTALWPMPDLRGAGEGKIARWLEHRLV
jgi:hypothetical protein